MSQLALSKHATNLSESAQPFQFKDQETQKRDAYLKDSFQDSSLLETKAKNNDFKEHDKFKT